MYLNLIRAPLTLNPSRGQQSELGFILQIVDK